MNSTDTNITDAQLIKAIKEAEQTVKTGASALSIGRKLGITKQGAHERLERLRRDGIVEKLHTGYGLSKTGRRLAK